MSRSIVLLLLAQSLLAGCSFVYDPDDHVAATDPCDVDRDGFRAATAACGGDDCDDASSTRYPGAPPACDGATPNDCLVADLVPELRSTFSTSTGAMVDFGLLPYETIDDLASPSALTAPPLQVDVVGFETPSGPQATVAFVAGSDSASRDARVLLFNYDPRDPAAGVVDDPALAVPSAFALGGVTATTARVMATQRNFVGSGAFLWYRDVVSGGNRPTMNAGTSATFGIPAVNYLVRPTVGLAGAYDPIANAADNPQMMFVLRGVSAAQDSWTRIPWNDVTAGAMRYVNIAAGPIESTRLWPTTSGEAFALTENSASPWVWERTADSGDTSNESGVVSQYTGVDITSTGLMEPVILPRQASTVPMVQPYRIFFVDAQGRLNLHIVACGRTSPGTAAGQSTCASISTGPLTLPDVEIRAFDAARTPGDGTMLVLSARDPASNERGVMLYYLPDASSVPVPFAHKDAMGRPWLVPPQNANGGYFDRVALTVLDEAWGTGQRWTVAVAGISDYTIRQGASVTVTGVVACAP